MFPFHTGRGRNLVLAALVAIVGCRPAEKIRSYTVPKETQRTVAKPGEPVDRMVTAIVPDGERAWFYKIVGPIPIIDEHAEAVLSFVASVPPSGGAALPPWKLPEGWTAKPGDGFRLATILIPADGKPLELTVTTLAWQGTPEQLLQNVNRWRGQLGLKSLARPEQLADDTRQIKSGDNTITIVDLRGQSSGSGMMPPFAGRGGPRGGDVDSSKGMPAGHPPIGDSTAPLSGNMPLNAAPQNDTPTLQPPATWKTIPAGGVRRAAYNVTGDGGEAQVTVINFPSTEGSKISDPLENINRWRVEVGLPRVTAEQLKDVSESIEIGGQGATYVAAIPDASTPAESRSSKATLAAMVTNGNQVWFFKMLGDRELVAGQQDDFKSFLKSVKFPADSGAKHGD